jgi:hypothetical protein
MAEREISTLEHRALFVAAMTKHLEINEYMSGNQLKNISDNRK